MPLSQKSLDWTKKLESFRIPSLHCSDSGASSTYLRRHAGLWPGKVVSRATLLSQLGTVCKLRATQWAYKHLRYVSKLNVSVGNRQYTIFFHPCAHSHLNNVGSGQPRAGSTDLYRSHSRRFARFAEIEPGAPLRWWQRVSIYRLETMPLVSRLQQRKGPGLSRIQREHIRQNTCKMSVPSHRHREFQGTSNELEKDNAALTPMQYLVTCTTARTKPLYDERQ